MNLTGNANMDKRVLLSLIPLLVVMAWALVSQATPTNAQAPARQIPNSQGKPAKTTNSVGTAPSRGMNPRPARPQTFAYDYTYAESPGAIVPGTDDTGNHCDDCSVPFTLPFAYTLYDQTFTSGWINSNGTL